MRSGLDHAGTYLSQRNGGRSTNNHTTNGTAGVITNNVVSLVEHGSQALQSHREVLDGSFTAVVAENAEQERRVRASRTVLVLETNQRPLSELVELGHKSHGNAVGNIGQRAHSFLAVSGLDLIIL